MPDYLQKTIAAYNQSADKYLDSTKDMTPPKEFQQFVSMVEHVGKPVLDAGCAFGRDTAAFSEQRFEPIGIDLSDELLKKARELYPKLTFKKMDVRMLNFDNDTFAGIWCHAVLLHLNDDDVKQALKEFHRVLKNNGVLFVSFKKGKGSREFVEAFSNDYPRFYNFKTKESLIDLLTEAGFKDINTYYINEQELFGPAKRDLDWLHCFSVKA